MGIVAEADRLGAGFLQACEATLEADLKIFAY